MLGGAGLLLIWWSAWEQPPRACRRSAPDQPAGGPPAVGRHRKGQRGRAAGHAAWASGPSPPSSFFAVTGSWPISGCFGLFGGWLPMAMVRWRARKRTAVLRQLWPDVVDHLRSAIRAGLSLPEALIQLGDKGPVELRHVFLRLRLRLPVGRPVRSLAHPAEGPTGRSRGRPDRRGPPADQGGGRLGPRAGCWAPSREFLRESARTRSELEARQSWTVNAARLAVAAPWIVLVLLASRPEAVAAYNTPVGAAVLLGGLAVSLVSLRRHAAHRSAAGRRRGSSGDRADGERHGVRDHPRQRPLAVPRQASLHAPDHVRRTHRSAAEVPQPGIPAPAHRAEEHHTVWPARTDPPPGDPGRCSRPWAGSTSALRP